MLRLLFKLLKVVLVLVLPFMVLVRGATYIHGKYDPGAFISLIGAGLITIGVLILYMTFVYEKMTDRIGGIKAFKNRGYFASFIIIGYLIHGLFFISGSNMKNVQLQKEIRQLHPIMRVAVSTVIMLDRGLIITDASRVPEDYRKMGLPTNRSSLHYRQNDGYAYALDLRTNSRSKVRNILLQNYFRIMGFQSMRHVGTDDHLHISLKCHHRKGAI